MRPPMTSKIPAHISRRGQKVKRAEHATWLLAIFTGIVAIFTAALAASSFWTISEERRASSERLGVQTWLYVDPKFDSKELRLARKKLAQQLDPYDPGKRDEMDDDVLDFLESVGALYNRGLLNKELAASSFSFRGNSLVGTAKAYIADTRSAAHDKSLYSDFERFAKAMRKHEAHLSDADLKDFLADEKALEAE